MKGIILIIVFLIIFVAAGTTFVFYRLNKTTNESKSMIGNKVVIEKDTLTIIDYSMFKETYTLSNNKEISFELVKKIKVIK